jgi:GxxExxY protein
MTPQRTQRAQSTAEVGERDPLTHEVIGAAIAVHKVMGPGLLESVYQVCLAHELRRRRVTFQTGVRLPIMYNGEALKAHLRLDLLVENQLVVELKSVEHVLPIHTAQLLTYLKLSGQHLGLLINFNVTRLVDGINRLAL